MADKRFERLLDDAPSGIPEAMPEADDNILTDDYKLFYDQIGQRIDRQRRESRDAIDDLLDTRFD